MNHDETIFEVSEAPEGGYDARALGHGIFTQGEIGTTWRARTSGSHRTVTRVMETSQHSVTDPPTARRVGILNALVNEVAEVVGQSPGNGPPCHGFVTVACGQVGVMARVGAATLLNRLWCLPTLLLIMLRKHWNPPCKTATIGQGRVMRVSDHSGVSGGLVQ